MNGLATCMPYASVCEASVPENEPVNRCHWLLEMGAGAKPVVAARLWASETGSGSYEQELRATTATIAVKGDDFMEVGAVGGWAKALADVGLPGPFFGCAGWGMRDSGPVFRTRAAVVPSERGDSRPSISQ